jgi:hypothetical protein
MAKEVLIVTGKDAGATFTELSGIVTLDPSTVGRRYDAAKQNLEMDPKLAYAKDLVEAKYRARIAELQV